MFGPFLTIWILEIFGILPLKNVKFRPPSSILSEIENVGYFKPFRNSDFEQILNQCKKA